MKRFSVIALSAAALLCGVLPGYMGAGRAQQGLSSQSAQAAQTADQIQTADSNFRASLAQTMSNAAAERGFAISTGDLVMRQEATVSSQTLLYRPSGA